MLCATRGCKNQSQVWISKGGVARRVCWDCADFLVADGGYVFLIPKPRS